MFQDLDATLQVMLTDSAAPAEVRAAEVRFDTPDKAFAPTAATLDLFLAEIQENRVLRDVAPTRERVGGVVVAHRAPLRVDCTYLVTAWSAASGGLKAAEEHRLLGLTLLWLSRFPRIEDRFLRGSLAAPAQPFPVALAVAQTREGENLGQFWSALGVAPRPAFALTATLALQPVPEADEYTPPTSIVVEQVWSADPALVGRVTDEALAPLAEFTVTVVEAGVEAAGVGGRFRIADLPFGRYTLLVQAPGHPDRQVEVEYRADRQVHSVVMSQP